MKQWREALRVALSDIRLNPVRSLLSMSGVVIGIASVTVILALGAGMRDMIYEKFSSIGLLEYRVTPGFNPRTLRMGELRPEHIELLKALPFVQSVYPETDLRGKSVRSPAGRSKADVLGIDREGAQEGRMELLAGRGFTPLELEERSESCLLSDELASELFPRGDPLGRIIWVEDVPWRVAGVFSVKKTTYMGGGRDQKSVLLPYRSLMRSYQDAKLGSIVVGVAPDFKEKPGPILEEALTRGDPARKGLYQILNWGAVVEAQDKMIRMATCVGALIAVISLLVGEIGVMNLMLTSVAERTREIGLRRALGARKIDVLGQFLVESSLFSGLGGVLGVLAGFLSSHLLAAVAMLWVKAEFRAKLLPSSVLVGVAVASVLGVLFGIYPASKAARLSPAEALRSE